MDMERLIDLMGTKLIAPLTLEVREIGQKMTILVGPDGRNGELSVLKEKVSKLEGTQAVQAAVQLAAQQDADKATSSRRWMWTTVVVIVLGVTGTGVALYNSQSTIVANQASAEEARGTAAAAHSKEVRDLNDALASLGTNAQNGRENGTAQRQAMERKVQSVREKENELEDDIRSLPQPSTDLNKKPRHWF
jgi:hypothetical protein